MIRAFRVRREFRAQLVSRVPPEHLGRKVIVDQREQLVRLVLRAHREIRGHRDSKAPRDQLDNKGRREFLD